MNLSFITRNSIAILLVAAMSSSVNAGIVASDNFEAGDWAAFWGSTVYATVASDLSKDGGYAAKLTYPGVAIDEDGWAELRFDLGVPYEELSIRFDLYIPGNYKHRDAPGGDNNKFFRLWSETYADLEKVGAGFLRQGSVGESSIGTDYRRYADWGVSTGVVEAGDFVTMDDVGKWMAVVIYVKAATDLAPAEVRIYKNGKLHLDDAPSLNYKAGTQGYRYGYLLGWANSGYTEKTSFYIDNVEFHNNDIMSRAPDKPDSFRVD